MANTIKPVVYYNDGSKLNLGEQITYDNIDRSKLSAFALAQDGKEILRLHLDSGQRLIWRKRCFIAPSRKEVVIHLVGWQKTVGKENVQSIAYVFEDGHIEMAGAFRGNHPLFGKVQLHKGEEGEEYPRIAEGASFIVEIHQDYVIKTPKNKKGRTADINLIAQLQNEVAKHFKEVLPCRIEDGKLIMERAKGELAADSENPKALRKRAEALAIEIKEKTGIEISDLTGRNIIYDKDTDSIYLIDFSSAKKENL